MEWTDISITVAKRDADTAEAIATMVANGGIYIEDYSDLEQQAWEIAHVDLIEQDLLDKPRDIVIVHMYLAPDENPAEVLPLFEERLKNSGIGYQLNTTGVEQEDWQNAWKKYQPWMSPREIPVFMISQIARVSHSAGILVLPSASA